MIELNSLWYSKTLDITAKVIQVGKNVLYEYGHDEYGIMEGKFFLEQFKPVI